MHSVENIHVEAIKDLITKFFYKDNFLCFQILLQMDGGEKVLYREFTDYAEYKKVFSNLQQERSDNSFINMPKNNFQNNSTVLKVA